MEHTELAGDVLNVQATLVQDDPSLPVAAKVALINVKSNVAVFDPVKAALAELAVIIAATPYDISTTAGEATARDLRARCVKLRTGTADLYKERNTPLLELQREMRKVVAEIEAGILPHETKLDEAIKEKDRLRDEEKQRTIAIEVARIQALRARITAVAGLPAQAALLDSSGILDLARGLQAVNADSFEEFEEEFESLAIAIESQLCQMLESAVSREAQTECNRLEAQRLEAERQQLIKQAADAKADLQRITDAAAEAATQKINDALVAANLARERDIADAAQRRLDADANSARAAQALKTQQDAFDAERKAALAEQLEERARITAARQALEDTMRKMEAAEVIVPAGEPLATNEASVTTDPQTQPGTYLPLMLDLTDSHNERPTDREMARVVAEHFDVEIDLAINWLEAFSARSACAESHEEVAA